MFEDIHVVDLDYMHCTCMLLCYCTEDRKLFGHMLMFMLCIQVFKKYITSKRFNFKFNIICNCILIFIHFRSIPSGDNKVCIISLIGKSAYHSNSSKASPLNHILDRDVFKVCISVIFFSTFVI